MLTDLYIGAFLRLPKKQIKGDKKGVGVTKCYIRSTILRQSVGSQSEFSSGKKDWMEEIVMVHVS